MSVLSRPVALLNGKWRCVYITHGDQRSMGRKLNDSGSPSRGRQLDKLSAVGDGPLCVAHQGVKLAPYRAEVAAQPGVVSPYDDYDLPLHGGGAPQRVGTGARSSV